MVKPCAISVGFLVLLFSSPRLFGAEPEVPPHAKGLMGCWQAVDNEKNLVRFEPKRCTFSKNGRIQFSAAEYEPGKVVLRVWGQKTKIGVKLDGDAMELTSRGKLTKMKRLAEIPKALVLQAMKLGAPAPVPKERLVKIKAELTRRIKEDQAVRKDASRHGDMQRVDAENTARLIEWVKELGWIDVTRFGTEASNAAFLIVQHSGNLPLMKACLPEIEKDVKARRVDGQNFGLLYDRLMLNLGEKQRFGSQIGRNEKGEMVVLPLQDRAKVDQFRNELGMPPLWTYLELFKRMNGGKEVKFLEE